ncbi:MAG: phosphatidylglycerophosphatase A [candidate division Zixibacteria bacterium]|nr:phosphatidylglycerophosphatase A [candidate division Zixibacteria bacterium]
MTQNATSLPVQIFHKFFATGIFTGYLPIAPGSWGSLLTCIILWFFWPPLWYYQLLIIAIFYPIAVYFAGKGVNYYGHDGKPIVIDEIIGQAVTLFMAPHSVVAYILGFFIFRLYDIIKPQPARSWEKLPGGLGIVADDIAAGVYAAITLQLIVVFLGKFGVELI